MVAAEPIVPPRANVKEATVRDVLQAMKEYHPTADFNLVQRAFVFAEHAHRNQRRKNGDPYIGHPVAVARILCEMRMDVQSVCAALLHDTVEDTEATHDELVSLFSEEIADLVDGVTDEQAGRDEQERQAGGDF